MSVSVLLIAATTAAALSASQDLRDLVLLSQPQVVQGRFGTLAVYFTLDNRTAKDITAWGVDLRVRRPDGTTVPRSYMEESFDTYEGVAPAEYRTWRLLLSGGVITRTVPIGSTEYADVEVSISFVIFADQTSLGNPQAIQEVFDERERIAKAWTVILAALKAGQASGNNREGLTVALRYLNSPSQDDFEHSDKQRMRRSLQSLLEGTAGGMPVDNFLAPWADRAQRIIGAANKHKRSGL